MAIELRHATAADVSDLGRVCYDAFKKIAEDHGFPPDFPSLEFAQQVMGMLVQNEQIYSVCAADGGALKGSNHVEMWDEVAAVGPVSVDPVAQGQGIGREMMLDGIANARAAGYEMVRLCQDAFNMQSLALYSSVGFDLKEPLAFMELSEAGRGDANFRPASQADIDAMDALCRDVYGVSRKEELRDTIQLGFPSFLIDRGGRVSAYAGGTLLGHGAAESDDEMLTLLAAIGASMQAAHAFIPLRNGELYRKALAAGHRNIKVMNLMALGPYAEPRGTYCPSVLY